MGGSTTARRRSRLSRWASGCLHPIQTDAVDYVVQRTELLVSACYLATLYASIRAWDASTAARRCVWLIAGVVAVRRRHGEQRSDGDRAVRRRRVRSCFPSELVEGARRQSLASLVLRRAWRDAGSARCVDRGWRARRLGGLRGRRSVVSLPLQSGMGDRPLPPTDRVAAGSAVRLRFSPRVWNRRTCRRTDRARHRRRSPFRRRAKEAAVARVPGVLVVCRARAVVERRSHHDGDRRRATRLSRVGGRHRRSRHRSGVRAALATTPVSRRFRGRRGAAGRLSRGAEARSMRVPNRCGATRRSKCRTTRARTTTSPR